MKNPSPHAFPPLLRMLICLKPDAAVQAAIDRFRKDANWPGRHHIWTPPQRLHLTLQCWDSFPASHVERLRAALHDTPVEPLDIVLRTPQLWNHRDAVLLAQPRAGLLALRQRLRAALARAGFHIPPGSSFQPHVTLAYNAPDAPPPPPEAAMPEIRWQVREFALVWSQQWPEYPRAHHELLQRYGLTPGRLPPPGETPAKWHQRQQLRLFADEMPEMPEMGARLSPAPAAPRRSAASAPHPPA